MENKLWRWLLVPVVAIAGVFLGKLFAFINSFGIQYLSGATVFSVSAVVLYVAGEGIGTYLASWFSSKMAPSAKRTTCVVIATILILLELFAIVWFAKKHDERMIWDIICCVSGIIGSIVAIAHNKSIKEKD